MVKPVLDTHFMARLKDQGLFKSVSDVDFVDEFDALPVDGFATPTDVHNFMARSNEALILTDGHGKITAINKPWFDMCGYTADEVQGKTCAVLQGAETDMEAVGDFDPQPKVHGF